MWDTSEYREGAVCVWGEGFKNNFRPEREGREREMERERERISEDMREFHEGVELFAMAGHLLWLKYRSQW